ncbi:MAG: C39 family peptidase [Desulfobacteraceae bacterium]|nr:C39 family peptidase [Desulfobacteraceae bacterium]
MKTTCPLARSGFIGLAALLLLTTPRVVAAGSALIDGGGTFNVPVVSFTEARFRYVVKQQYDFSCGSAALASLLTYHYARPTKEQEVFKVMWEHGDQQKIQKEGFSLLDMKNYLASIGYDAGGFRISLDKLRELRVPAIALVNLKGYLHFVVLSGVSDRHVLVSDPAVGLRELPRAAFEQMHNGIFFLIRNRADIALRSFNEEKRWRSITRSPNSEAVSRSSLAAFTLSLPARGDFN